MKKFLCGVADAYFYSTAEELLFQAKTVLDDSMEINVNSTEISAAKGDVLQFVYFHGGRINATLTDVQFSMDMIAANVGQDIGTSTGMWFEEEITLTGGGAGTVTNTPIVTPDGDTTIYGWVTQEDGTVTKVAFSTKDFNLPGGTSGEVVCVRYYITDTAARYIEIPANIIPKIGRLVLDAQLFSSNSGDANGATLIGRVQVEIPRFQLSGTQSLSMTSSGVSNTPLKGMALAYNEAGCNGSGTYAKITEKIDSSFWYSNCFALSLEDDTIAISSGSPTYQTVTYAIPRIGKAFIPPTADLTYTSSNTGIFTVNASGLITRVGAGSATLTIVITNKNTVTTTATITSA